MRDTRSTRPSKWSQYTDANGWHSQLYYHGEPLPLWVHRFHRPGRSPTGRFFVTQEPEGQLALALVDDNGRSVFNDLFKARNLARVTAAQFYT